MLYLFQTDGIYNEFFPDTKYRFDCIAQEPELQPIK